MSETPTGSISDISPEILTILQVDFKTELQKLLKSRVKWRKAQNYSETLAHFLMLCTSIIAISASLYKYESLIFITACLSVLSQSLLKFSSYCHNECVERNVLINNLLKRIEMREITLNTIETSI
jgi:hypothetical protein